MKLNDVVAYFAESVMGGSCENIGGAWQNFLESIEEGGYENKFAGISLPKEFDDLPNDALEVYDNLVFECARCNWTCWEDERAFDADESICGGCFQEEDDEEDE